MDIEKIKSAWSARDSAIKDDRAVLRLTKGKTKEGFEEVVMNEPKVLYDTSVGLLSNNFPKFRLPVKFEAGQDERMKMNKAERFLQGIYRQLDTRHLNAGKGQWLRELAYWVCSGWVVLFAHVSEDKFYADFYDPLTIFPRWSGDELVEVVRNTKISYVEALGLLKRWDITIDLKEKEEIEVINYWVQREDGAYNMISFDGTEIKPETREFDKIPIIIGLANGSPERDATDWTARIGQSILTSNKDMYTQQNRWVSMLTQIVADTAYPPIITQTPTGEGIIGKDDLGSGVVIPTKEGEKIETLKYAGSPIEVNNLLSMFSGAVQRGGLPYVIYGGLPFELSGFALSQLMGAVQYKISPYVNTMQQVLSRLSTEFVEQFRQHGKTVSLNIKNKTNQFFMEEFTRKDIPVISYVDVVVSTSAPQDKMQQILMGKQAVSPPRILSLKTLWETVLPELGIDDSDLELKRITEDETGELPFVKMLKMAEEMRKKSEEAYQRGETESSKVLMAYAQLIINQLMQGAQQGGQQGAQGGQQGGQGYSGNAGQGFRNNQVTPEQEMAARGERNPGGEMGRGMPKGGGM